MHMLGTNGDYPMWQRENRLRCVFRIKDDVIDCQIAGPKTRVGRSFGKRQLDVLFLLAANRFGDNRRIKRNRFSTLEYGVPVHREAHSSRIKGYTRLARRGIKIAEVPVDYRLRDTGSSKMRHISETLKFLWLVLWYRIQRC